MLAQLIDYRGRLRPGLLGLTLLSLFLSSCQRRPQMPIAPPPLNYLEMGDQSYDAGDYPGAIAAYSTYLRENPDSPARERVLFHLGMAYVQPSNPTQDPAQAFLRWEELAQQYPNSSLRLQADLIAGLHRQVLQLQQDISLWESQLAGLNLEMDQLSQQQASKIEQLQQDVTNREDRIRQLSEELERLKAIDMQRRPTPPPR